MASDFCPSSYNKGPFVLIQSSFYSPLLGDLHMGGVMLKLVEAMDIAMDWSDHALFWAERNTWLSRTRYNKMTLKKALIVEGLVLGQRPR